MKKNLFRLLTVFVCVFAAWSPLTVAGVSVRSKSDGVGGIGLPGVNVRLRSGGVGGGVVVIKNNKGINTKRFIGE